MRSSGRGNISFAFICLQAAKPGLPVSFAELLHLRYSESLYPSSMRYMGTKAKVDEWPASVHRRLCPIWNFIVDVILLVLVVLRLRSP